MPLKNPLTSRSRIHVNIAVPKLVFAVLALRPRGSTKNFYLLSS